MREIRSAELSAIRRKRSSLCFKASSACLRSVMSVVTASMHSTPAMLISSAESNMVWTSPDFRREWYSSLMIRPLFLRCLMIFSRSLGNTHISSSFELLPSVSLRVYPCPRVKLSFTSRNTPSASVEIDIALGLERKALENFSSDSRNATSACLRSEISRTNTTISPSSIFR